MKIIEAMESGLIYSTLEVVNATTDLLEE